MTAYTLFILGQALAPNIETLIVTRFFSGFFAVAPPTVTGGKYSIFEYSFFLNLSSGVITDIWPAVGRGSPTTLFTASVFFGPVLGPIVAGL